MSNFNEYCSLAEGKFLSLKNFLEVNIFLTKVSITQFWVHLEEI